MEFSSSSTISWRYEAQEPEGCLIVGRNCASQINVLKDLDLEPIFSIQQLGLGIFLTEEFNIMFTRLTSLKSYSLEILKTCLDAYLCNLP